MQGGGRKRVPFEVGRDRRQALVDQVVDGLRTAILDGYYGPGEVLPSIKEMAAELGVSRIVTETAVRRLGEEGYTAPRPRIGSVVLDRGGVHWRGSVLLIERDGPAQYYTSVFGGTLIHRLLSAGYQVVKLPMLVDVPKRIRMASLESVLRHHFDLAILTNEAAEIERALSAHGVKFIASGTVRSIPGCLGCIRLDSDTALGELAASVRRRGIGSVMEVGFASNMCLTPHLRRLGVAVRQWDLDLPIDSPAPAIVERMAMEKVRARLARGRGWLPEMFFFNDDYVGEGALKALSAAGIRIPRDVRVSTWANAGSGPVWPDPLDLIRMDPKANGDRVADRVLACLAGAEFHEGLVKGPEFVPAGFTDDFHPSSNTSKGKAVKHEP